MELEKEVRFEVSDETFNKIKLLNTKNTLPIQVLDITCGAYGKESMQKTGRVFRVRQKGNKCTLEIKKRTEDKNWIEESIVLESAEQGLNFFSLSGLQPYLYINRMRTSFNYGNLKIDLDDVELLGKFVEIEYQDSEDAETELKNFIEICNITGDPAPLYGTIILNKQDSDQIFNQQYNQRLKNLINT